MTDTLTTAERSALMKRVRRSDTTPEMVVRRALHRRGFRYVLNDRRLPGSPDLVFPSRRKVIFVHGCFWHYHQGCARAKIPSTRPEFWAPKLAANRARDKAAVSALRRAGWRVMTVWECELLDADRAIERIVRFLERE